jgi:hypothetical protein
MRNVTAAELIFSADTPVNFRKKLIFIVDILNKFVKNLYNHQLM